MNNVIRKSFNKDKSKIKVPSITNRIALHIRGMEATTSKEEVIQALLAKVGKLGSDSYKISDIRPNAYGTQAITVSIDNKIGKSRIK